MTKIEYFETELEGIKQETVNTIDADNEILRHYQ